MSSNLTPISPYSWHSLQTRITVLTLSAFLVCIWSLSLITSQILQKDIEQLLSQQQFATVSLHASDIERTLGERINTLESVSKLITPALLKQAAALQQFILERPVLPDFFNGGFFVTDANGTAIASYPESAQRIGLNYLDRDHVASALQQGKNKIGKPIISKTTGSPVVSFAVPVRDPNGLVVGAVVGVIDLGKPNFLDQTVSTEHANTGGYLLVAAPWRVVITATDKTQRLKDLPAVGINPGFDRFSNGFEGSAVIRNAQGHEMLVSVKRIALAQWGLVATLPAAEAFAPANRMSKNLAMTALLASLLAGAITWWVLRRQLKPLHNAFLALTRQTDAQQTPQALPQTRHDEVGQLINGFNRALEALAQREAALNDAQVLLVAVINAIPMRIFWKDQQLNFLGCNTAFAQDAGMQTPAQLIGKDDYQMGWARQADCYRADDRQVLDSGINKLFYDEPQTTPDGKIVWLRTSKTALKDHHGRIFGVLGVYEDITQRRQAQEQLRKLSQVAEQSPECVVIANLGASIEYVNEAFVSNTGYSRVEALGQNPRILKSSLTPKATFEAMWETLTQGKTWSGELVNQRKDHSIYTEWAVISPLRNDAGLVTHYVAIKQDITEKKRAAAELEQHRHKLEELVVQRTAELSVARELADAGNRSKSEFLANMSHEIRTPMNGVIGMVDVLAQTPLTPEQRRMLETINGSSMALMSILNDILDFSKIEAGKLDVEQIPTRLREEVEGAAQLMLNVANSKGAEVSLFIDPDLPEWIICDPTRLRQILLNLLGNAIKFVSHRTGHAMLHVQPAMRPDGSHWVQLSVIDNGIGMSPEVIARLFQPFTQADTSTMRRFGGTGLGLSITQRLVEMLHGTVSVQSAPGIGSEFIVELPLQAAPPPAGHVAQLLPDLHGVNVLAVTPNLACMTLFQMYLGSVGARVKVLPSLNEAWSYLAGSSQDTVLLLDLTQACDPESVHQMALAHDVRVVRLVRRRSSGTEAQVIEVPARPLIYHELIQGVALACGRLTVTELVGRANHLTDNDRSAPSVEEALQAGQLILMAEDNETNRDVMSEQLRLIGYAVEVAFDGAMALEMWRSGRYALLLTDCHMPIMDGFELTAAIRQSEPAGSRLPIIAITANAMQGEAERCIDRGMDGYLCKPMRMRELAAMLAKWLPLPDAAQLKSELIATDALSSGNAGHFDIWNSEILGDLVGDNPILQKRLLAKFLDNARVQGQQIQAALAGLDLPAVKGLAHTLKSAARSVGALALGELCQQLEAAANSQDLDACIRLAQELPATLDAAIQRIQAHLAA